MGRLSMLVCALAPTEERVEWEIAEGVAASESQHELEETFYRIAEQWRAETGFVSSINKAAMHPAYQRIIGMGQTVVPFLLRELKERPDHWFWALTSITGHNPVPAEHAGDMRRMTDAWLEWGTEHGYIV